MTPVTIIDGYVSEIRFAPGGKTAYVILAGTDTPWTLDVGTSSPTKLIVDGAQISWQLLVGYIARARVSVVLTIDSVAYERVIAAKFTTEA